MKEIDTTSWWYKNCVRQRKNKAKICDSCPFKKDIEEKELECNHSFKNADKWNTDLRKCVKCGKTIDQIRNNPTLDYFGSNLLTEEQLIKLREYWENKNLI